MCKFHEVKKKLISDVHSCRDAEFTFGVNEYIGAVEDDENTANCREVYLKNPCDKNALLALGDAFAYQMRYNEAIKYYNKACELYPSDYLAHRKLAVRHLSVLNLDMAKEQLIWCAERTDNPLDVNYLLAITEFCRGEYAEAIELLTDCYELCRQDGEMYVAVLYWHIQCLVKLGRSADEALNFYFDGLDGGHHVGYMKTVEVFLHKVNADGVHFADELNDCIFRYGMCAYYQNNEDYIKAAEACRQALALDTYFSSFAYLGAFCENRAYETASEKLKKFFKEQDGVALAFSGGVDSALLLKVARDLGVNIKAYLVCSEFQPYFEIDDAMELVGGVCEKIDLNVLSNNDVAKNEADRCYHCKNMILGKISECAKRDGYGIIIDGTNADDNLNDRPGARVLTELNIISPLRACGFTKVMIRRASQELGLFTYNKPSYSCLATRVATGERITDETLKKIESAEAYLFLKGYKNFRVRVKDNNAKIEVAKKQNEKFQTEKAEIFKELSKYFDGVSQSEVLR